MIQRLLKEYGPNVLKGMAMGAADVVPGVSGGTIAFISGIYEKLISSINMINMETFRMLFKDGIKPVWNRINGAFLLSLFMGIVISLLSLAKLITYLLDHHAIVLWSFFFGLILASIYYVGKSIKKWDAIVVIGLIAGTAISYWITILPPSSNSGAHWFIFVSGMIAICAMILPGISGSFILLLLGSYQLVLEAVNERDLLVIAIFAAGCISGLLSFSKLLNLMFNKFYNTTIAILTGFLVGSLNKIWPWKETLQFRENSHGEMVPFIQTNVSPETYSTLYQDPSMLTWAIVLAIAGFSVIFALEQLAISKK